MLRRSWETKKNIIKELNNRLNENRIIIYEESQSGENNCENKSDGEKKADLEIAKTFAESMEKWWEGSNSTRARNMTKEFVQFFCRYNYTWDDDEDEAKNQFEKWAKSQLKKIVGKNNCQYNKLKKWIEDIGDQIDDNFQNTVELVLENDDGEVGRYSVEPEMDVSIGSYCQNYENSAFKLRTEYEKWNRNDTLSSANVLEPIDTEKELPFTGINLKVTNADSSSVTLTWEDATNSIDANQEEEFVIYRNKFGENTQKNPNAWKEIYSRPGGDKGDIFEYVDTTIDVGNKKYGYKVYGRNEKGLSENNSNIVWVTPNTWTPEQKDGTEKDDNKKNKKDGEGEEKKSGNTKGGGTTTFTETNINSLEDINDNPKTHIKVGLKGDLINSIQTLIKGDGIESVGKVDSKFGANTKKGVEEFQRKYNLTDDGIVGPKTAQKLIEVREKFLENVAKTSENKETFIQKMKFIVPKIDTSNPLKVNDIIQKYDDYRRDSQKPTKEEIDGMKSVNIFNISESEISKPILDMMRRMNILK